MSEFLVKAVYVAVPVLVTVGLIRKYLDTVWGHCRSTHSLRGKTFLITGANSGIGFETAKALVKRNARVIFACRDAESAKKATENIRKEHKVGGEMIIMQVDLSSFESIRSFVNVVKTGFSKIDVLINNAGVYVPLTLDEKTKDGFEIHMGVNHLGHFLLTNLLIELLEKAAPSRVVILSSVLQERGEIDFDDLNLNGMIAAVKDGDKAVVRANGRTNLGYCNSKLMNVYFGRALAKRTAEKGIDVFMVCPGFTYTGLFRRVFKWYHLVIMAPIMLFYMRSSKQGSQTVLHCATETYLEGHTGMFFRNCVPYTSKRTYDQHTESRLWEVSEELVKM